jgi:signal transduction histidine kinase
MTHSQKEMVELNLAELIKQTLSAMGREPAKDGIELILDVPTDLTLKTRRVEFQQVLLNLFINARSAVLAKGGSGKRIQVTSRRGKGVLELTVADSGTGIAAENLEKVFEPFFTTKKFTDDNSDGGHGLGLCICREIIVELGGTISVQSKPTQGASFSIRIPQ